MSSDRRDFLKFLFGGASLGIGLSPIELLIKSAIFESHNQALAQTQLKKFYFNIAFPGAPDRITYDLFLDPYGNGNNVIPSLGVATCYDSSDDLVYDIAAYKTFKVPKHNISAPWMWGQKMPTSDGFVPIYSLMDNMLLFQGIHTVSPGHGASLNRMEEANNLTIAGILSDTIYTPFNAISMNSPYSFKSKGSFNTALTDSINQNIIATLMNNFNSNRIPTAKNLKNEVKDAFKNAIDNINYDTALKTPNSINLKKTYDGAVDIITNSITDFSSIWSDKLNKYKSITQQSCTDRDNFNGFMDKPIGVKDNRDKTYDFGDKITCIDSDLRDLIYQDTAVGMSSIFAVSEFIADNKYATSVSAKINGMAVMATLGSETTATRKGVTHDQHNIGVMVRTLTNAFMYRSLSACLYEFRKFLQTESKGFNFNDSVIRLNGEFARSVKADGSGADHGYLAANSMVLSGMIDQPAILGRIYKDGVASKMHGSGYAGSWGVGAPMSVHGLNTVINQGHILSSLSAMLGITSPAFNNPSLIKVRNSKVELVDANYKLKVV